MSDFVGGAAYPQGEGPYAFIGRPATGDTVTGAKIYVVFGAFAGNWVNDPGLGIIPQVELFVDGSLASIWNGGSTALIWNTRKTASGTHALIVRVYTMDIAKTRACYLDSEVENPVLQ